MTANLVISIALGAVAVVLVLGLFNMMRGGDSNRSQVFMRWRVALQLVAIVVIMGALWLRS
jgi:heme/copper-type cytochrome/quinol oxidase subunit 4